MGFDPHDTHYVWTYTPGHPKVIAMHEKYGAKNTMHVIQGARDVTRPLVQGLSRRPFDTEKHGQLVDVNMMCYKE